MLPCGVPEYLRKYSMKGPYYKNAISPCCSDHRISTIENISYQTEGKHS